MRGDRERQAGMHAAGITLNRRIDEGLNPGEVDDLVELPNDLRAIHAENCAIEKYVFSPRELGVEAGSDFKQRSGPTLKTHFAGRRRGDLGNDLEQRALTRAVAPDDTDYLPLLNRQRHVPQRPKGFDIGRMIFKRRSAKRRAAPLRKNLRKEASMSTMNTAKIFFADAENLDRGTHTSILKRTVRSGRQGYPPCSGKRGCRPRISALWP